MGASELMMGFLFSGSDVLPAFLVLLMSGLFYVMPITSDENGDAIKRGGMPFAAMFGTGASIMFLGWFGAADGDQPKGALLGLLILLVVAVIVRYRSGKRVVTDFSSWVVAAGCAMSLLTIIR